MRSPAGPAVSITELVKKYPKSDTPAVDGLDLEVSDGETLALLGPNGAGKSTTVGTTPTSTGPVRLRTLTHRMQVDGVGGELDGSARLGRDRPQARCG